MPQQSNTYPFSGGLDLVTPPVQMKPGRLIAAKNYEPSRSGYRRMGGYERFDGQARPSDTDDPAEKATRRTAIQPVPGTGPVRGVVLLPDHAGGGTNDVVYAFRDNSPDMGGWRARPSSGLGWTAITECKMLGFNSGGIGEPSAGDTVSNAPEPPAGSYVLSNFVKTGGDWAADSATGYVVFHEETITGSINLSGSANHAYSGGNYIPGASLFTTKTGGYSGSSDLMHGRFDFDVGTFTGAANSERVYACNGLWCAFELFYDSANDRDVVTPIATSGSFHTPTAPYPTRIAIHNNHLFLGFSSGSLINSETLYPYTFSALGGASEVGLGSTVTNLLPEVSGTLLVTGVDKVSVLYGSDADTFELRTPGGEDAGAYAWTAQKAMGALYMDAGGVRDLTATEKYGNFEAGTLTRLVKPWLDAKRDAGVTPTASMRVTSKDQYRLFFSDGSGLFIYIESNRVEVLPFVLPIVVSCAWSGIDGAGRERLFAGATDGYVYELDRGDSFDGEPIEFFARTPFNFVGAVNQEKRAHKAIVELDCNVDIELALAAELNYAAPDVVPAGGDVVTTPGRAAYWDDAAWDGFEWSAAYHGRAELHVDGLFENISLQIAGSDTDTETHTLTAYTLLTSPRKFKR